MANVGPALPPHLLRQRQAEGQEPAPAEEKNVEAKKKDEGEPSRETENENDDAPVAPMMFGAALPPHLLEERRKREEEEEKRKQEAAAAPPRRRVIGPALEDLVAAPEEPEPTADDDEGEEQQPVEVLGPLRPDDPRARKPQVKTRAALPTAPAYSLDPEERKQRSKRDIIEGRNKKGGPADKKQKTDEKARTGKDKIVEDYLQLYNEKHRGESLVAQHAKTAKEKQAAKEKAKEDEEWKPWDRDEMGSRHLPKQARESVMRKAKDFHSRFSAQSGSRFL